MHVHNTGLWEHGHHYQSGHERDSERRVLYVVALTAVMMVIEITCGYWFNSMALLADGWHMFTHAGALGITAFAYIFARRQAGNPRFTFGTGKVNALGGFTSAIVLALVGVLVVTESIVRLRSPLTIDFDEAMWVAVAGLVVNIVSAWLLQGSGHSHGHHHDHTHTHTHTHDSRPDSDSDSGPGSGSEHDYAHDHAHGYAYDHAHGYEEQHEHGLEHKHSQEHQHRQEHKYTQEHKHGHAYRHADTRGFASNGEVGRARKLMDRYLHKHDHNLKAAYMHVIADAMTSVLAITALSVGKFWDWVWMDAVMGIVGSAIIVHWAIGLIRQTGAVLLDRAPDAALEQAIRTAIENDADNKVTDLHLWSIAPGKLSAIVSLVTDRPQPPNHYKDLLQNFDHLVHVTIEVNRCEHADAQR